MPIPSPFHPRTSQLCTSLLWKDWAGYYAVRSYDTSLEPEYHAIRHAAGLLDVTPLFKYDITGRDAAEFLSWVMVRDVTKLKRGRMTYLCWCDDDGKVVDDGTVAHLSEQHYRVTAAEPTLAWLQRHAPGFDVHIEDSTRQLAALALQGPFARDILAHVAGTDVTTMKYFGIRAARIGAADVWISRTGYTGDLGYEVWIPSEHAVAVWDVLMEAGQPYCIQPTGLDALDLTRVEAGFIMNGVDYFSAHQVPIESRKSTPFEINLGWTVQLERAPFMGQAALRAERARGPMWRFVGLEIDWDEFEALFANYGLPPQMPLGAWRTPVPVLDATGEQVGQATSGAWSPMLKKNLALASVLSPHAHDGHHLMIEVTAEYHRRFVTATVTPLPFFDPERKRA